MEVWSVNVLRDQILQCIQVEKPRVTVRWSPRFHSASRLPTVACRSQSCYLLVWGHALRLGLVSSPLTALIVVSDSDSTPRTEYGYEFESSFRQVPFFQWSFTILISLRICVEGCSLFTYFLFFISGVPGSWGVRQWHGNLCLFHWSSSFLFVKIIYLPLDT